MATKAAKENTLPEHEHESPPSVVALDDDDSDIDMVLVERPAEITAEILASRPKISAKRSTLLTS